MRERERHLAKGEWKECAATSTPALTLQQDLADREKYKILFLSFFLSKKEQQ